jgi:hypothetical protein
LKKTPDWRPIQFVVIPETEVPNQLAIAGEGTIWIRQQSAAVEAEVDVIGIGNDMAEAILEGLAGEGEADGNRVSIDQRFDCRRSFLKHDLAKRKGETCDVRIIGSKAIQELAIGRTGHDRYSLLAMILRIGSLSA